MPNVRRRLLTFVVVGGGPTGVEMAGAIAELARKAIVGDFRNIDSSTAHVVLVEAGTGCCRPSRRSFRIRPDVSSKGLVSRCRLGSAVTHCDADGVVLADGWRIRLALRGVGSRRHGLQGRQHGSVLWPTGRDASWSAATFAFLAIRKYSPSATPPSAKDANGRPVPGVAPAAKQMGRYVARQSRRRLAGKAAIASVCLCRLRQSRHDRPTCGRCRFRPVAAVRLRRPGWSGASHICGSWSASATALSFSSIGHGPMQHLIVPRASSPAAMTASFRFPRIALGRAVTALLLLAVLSTAAIVHVIWQRTAIRNVDNVVASLDQQRASAVRSELSSTLATLAGTAEIIRSILFQDTIKINDEVKREFLFLSLLREQPSIGWIGFGFPDGRFFGSHATGDGRIEMVEIGAGAPGAMRPLRRDLYHPIPGDVMFDERLQAESAYVAGGAAWYRRAKESGEAAWSVVEILPNGFEPSVVVSKRVELYGRYQGVVMVAARLTRLAETLGSLDPSGVSKAFVLGGDGTVLATSDSHDGVMAAHLADFPASDALAAAVSEAVSQRGAADFRTLVDGNGLGPIYVSSSTLPFEGWRLLTAIPRSVLAGDIDRNARRVLYVVAGLALLAAATAALFATLMFARPIARLAAQLRQVERFALDEVRHVPTFLAELNDFSSGVEAYGRGPVSLRQIYSARCRQTARCERHGARAGRQPVRSHGAVCRPAGFHRTDGAAGPRCRTAPDQLPDDRGRSHPRRGRYRRQVHRRRGDGHLECAEPGIRPCLPRLPGGRGNLRGHARPACDFAERDEIRVRIGINTGTALVGNVGSAERLSYTVIGDTVNLASRLVGVAKEHGVEIVMSGMTVAAYRWAYRHPFARRGYRSREVDGSRHTHVGMIAEEGDPDDPFDLGPDESQRLVLRNHRADYLGLQSDPF